MRSLPSSRSSAGRKSFTYIVRSGNIRSAGVHVYRDPDFPTLLKADFFSLFIHFCSIFTLFSILFLNSFYTFFYISSRGMYFALRPPPPPLFYMNFYPLRRAVRRQEGLKTPPRNFCEFITQKDALLRPFPPFIL